MPAPFSTLVLDLHNTIYDEALEYGLAMEEGIRVWQAIAARNDKTLSSDAIHAELAQAHRRLGSDFDSDAWRHMPSLTSLGLGQEAFERALAQAETQRKRVSKEFATATLYPGIRDTLAALKKRGVRIHVVTEAPADAGMEVLGWLNLGGIIDGFYSYPSRIAPQSIAGTYHKPFANGPSGGHLRKPNPLLLAAVALDEAIYRGAVPADITLHDAFEIRHDAQRLLAELPESAPIQHDICARLEVTQTPYAATLGRILGSMLYVGDSKFKDGLLARNAGIAFGFAAYGKKIKSENVENHARSLAIMYAVTGWEPDELKLTQEAGKSASIAALRPEYSFENGLSEALGLFR